MVNETEKFDLMMDVTRRMAAFALAIACGDNSDKIDSVFEEIEKGIIESGYFGFGDKNELIGAFVAQYKETTIGIRKDLDKINGELE